MIVGSFIHVGTTVNIRYLVICPSRIREQPVPGLSSHSSAILHLGLSKLDIFVDYIYYVQ